MAEDHEENGWSLGVHFPTRIYASKIHSSSHHQRWEDASKCDPRADNGIPYIRTDIVAGLAEALQDAGLQIEHLHSKFQETGSGNAALYKIQSILAAYEQATKP